MKRYGVRPFVRPSVPLAARLLLWARLVADVDPVYVGGTYACGGTERPTSTKL